MFGYQAIDSICLASTGSSCVSDFDFISVSTTGLKVSGVVGLAANPSIYHPYYQIIAPKGYISALYDAGAIEKKMFSFALLDTDSYLDIGSINPTAFTNELVWIDSI